MLHGLTNRTYQLEAKPFSSGGEGDVYRIVGQNDLVAKIYHLDRRTKELEQKVTRMANNPPAESVLNQVAWPLDVLYSMEGAFYGFVMPKLRITAELSQVYVYPPKTSITFKQKLILAENICVVIHAVHEAGYVFGDFNPRNIGIDMQTGMVAFLDTDSYHIVVDKNANQAYRCNVCAPGYCAPELLQKCADHIAEHPEDSAQAYAKTPLDTFTKETDNFALAIHVFRLLMNGFTPYGGIKETESASVGSPGVGDSAVKRDSYSFKKGNKPQSAAVPPITIHPKYIQKLFTRAFVEGRNKPGKRPTAAEWHKALAQYENELIQCKKHPTHYYLRNLKACPWCEADDKFAESIAPRPTMQQKSFGTPVTPGPAPSSRSGSYYQQGSNYQPPRSQQTSGFKTTTSGTNKKSGLPGKFLKPNSLFKAWTLMVFAVGWVSFIGVIVHALRPFVNNGSFNFSTAILARLNIEQIMLYSCGSMFLVTMGSALYDKAKSLSCLLSGAWGLAVCTAWALLKTGQIYYLESADPAEFLGTLSTALLVLFCIIYYSNRVGTNWRLNHYKRLFAHPKLGYKECLLIVIGLAITGSYIWLLADLPLYFRILANHNLSSPILLATPIVLYALLTKGKEYGTKYAIHSLTCTAFLTFFTCFLLWVLTLQGDVQDTLKTVLGIAGLLGMWILHSSMKDSVKGLTCIFMVVEYVSCVSPQLLSLQSHVIRIAEKTVYLTAFPPVVLWGLTVVLLLYETIKR